MCCGTSDIGMTCLPLSMMNTCMDEKSIYFSIICCRSWLAVNVLWHKWHWNDLSSTLHDDHLCTWKTQIFFKYLLQKLTCSKCVVAQVTLEWLVFHSLWWTLLCMKNPNIFQVLVAKLVALLNNTVMLPTTFCCHYSKLIIHRTFQFPGIINFITTRCQQLFAKHLLLNITLFYALLHSFFQIFTIKTPQKPDQYRTRAWVRSGSGPVRSGSGIFQSGPVRFRCNTSLHWTMTTSWLRHQFWVA